MDSFREWLSDNLRYIILGGIIIILLVAIFIFIRMIGGIKTSGDSNTASTDTTDTTTMAASTDSAQTDSTTSPEEKDTTTQGDTTSDTTQTTADSSLQLNSYPEVTSLITTYYTALGNKDIDGIKGTIDTLSKDEEDQITKSQYIESYSNIEIYTKAGSAPDSYIVYACYKYKFKDIDTMVPGLSQLYVDKNSDGKLQIVSSPDEAIQKEMEESKDDEVTSLTQRIENEYQQALNTDEALKNFLGEIGVVTSDTITAANGTQVKAINECNIRKEPSADADMLGTLPAGQAVTKTGTSGDWLQVDYNGETGYVRGDLVEIGE